MSELHTRCPRCATVFRAGEELLAAAEGKVRCGHCDEVFDARAAAIEPPVEEPAIPAPGLLTADYLDELLHEPPPRAAPAETASAPATATRAALPVEIGAPPPPRWRARDMRWSIAAALFVALLGARYAWISHERWTQDPQLRPHLESACALLGCRLPPYRDPASIRSTELLVRPDPARAGVLLVDAVLENRSDFAQRYPRLELSFTDIRGKPVARRVFEPREYLGAHPQPDALIASRVPVRVHLELEDPGEHATNYELRLTGFEDEAPVQH